MPFFRFLAAGYAVALATFAGEGLSGWKAALLVVWLGGAALSLLIAWLAYSAAQGAAGETSPRR